ncbi:2-hydroxyacid dehydrogenase [Sphingomonas sp. PR090111-T3T-6A]|uniref:2-hydroxyacid dehydrogenase n=1 Tax=Sphingomonas sp. PR090111-T3T-6A TaxID=685778 RepID=UPI0003732E6C|nr:D-glycerate dehydrogenase [Sphingomonas sp. PR090111-T3T-6A]
MDRRPRLLVTRRLPHAVEAHLSTRFETDGNADDAPLSREALADAMTRYDAILPTITDRIDAALLSLPGATVRILANFGAGFEHIDLAAARKAGIAVTNTPDALTDTTADLAILLMLMAARRAGEGERELRDGRWTGWRPTHLIGQGVTGKTLGLVGFGRIAQATAKRARAFGMRIRYVSRNRASETIEAACDASPAESLEALAAEADILSLHVPGGAATRHLIDAPLLARMKPHAILINTARGPVVDEAALAEALTQGRLGAAGLDVYEQEPAVHPALLACERAVLLPHLGSATIETRSAMGMQAASNLEAFFDGREPPNRVA